MSLSNTDRMKGKIQANTKALYSTEDENAHLDTKIDGMRINMSVAGDNTAVILEKIKQDYARQCNVKKIMTGVGKTISSLTQDVVIKEKRRVLLSPEKLPGTKRARTFREFGQDTELRVRQGISSSAPRMADLHSLAKHPTDPNKPKATRSSTWPQDNQFSRRG